MAEIVISEYRGSKSQSCPDRGVISSSLSATRRVASSRKGSGRRLKDDRTLREG